MDRMVALDPASKTYSLGAGLADLAGRALDPESAFTICQPRLALLTRETGATCALWRVTREERLLHLGSASNGQATRIHLEAGQRIPLALGAAGRSVLAARDLNREEIAALFAAVRWDHPPTLATYLDEIETTRRTGWATDDGAYIGGVTTVAAAVKDKQGDARFCVSTLLFSGQRTPAELARAGAATRLAADEISNILYGA